MTCSRCSEPATIHLEFRVCSDGRCEGNMDFCDRHWDEYLAAGRNQSSGGSAPQTERER